MTPARDRTPDSGRKITRDDIEAKLRELQGEVSSAAETAKNTAVVVGAVVVTTIVVAAFLMGRRSARKRRMVLEIRRI